MNGYNVQSPTICPGGRACALQGKNVTAFPASSVSARLTVVLPLSVQEKTNKTESSHSRSVWDGSKEGKITKNLLHF